MVRILIERMPSPLGEVIIGTDDRGALRLVDFADYEPRMHRLLRRHYGKQNITLVETKKRSAAARAINAYFKGDLAAIKELKTANGGTDFQRAVWKALHAITPGTTTTYGTLASRLGMPKAARAVGLANGANPIAIVVPCHRVIGADGALTGYGGGMARKQWLLAHEAGR
jgi:methylated-DNA-[protein]-cysteine S-methyltransferase